jgi:hypothetical protein
MGVVVLMYVVHLGCIISSFARRLDIVGRQCMRGEVTRSVCEQELGAIFDLLQMFDNMGVRS